MSSSPLLSVIVACRNPGPRIHYALESLWAQEPTQPEIVVIDGASRDGTREWLESQRPRLSAMVSEPDSGPYAAMNRGVALAGGHWVLFLGADDRLVDRYTLAEASRRLRQTHAGVVAGEAVYDDGRRYFLRPRPTVRARNFVHHQATFYRRSLFAEHGPFDESFRVMADYEFNLRLWCRGVVFRALRLHVTTCGSGGISDSGRWLGYAEEIRARRRHFPPWQCWLWDAGSTARFLRKRLGVGRPWRAS